MDQFDRSPEDVSFDLDAEEYSLESILDEYKDFQTDAPAPRPQPAYRSRPVTAEMIEEEEAEDAEAEDILMSAELDSALKAADPEAAASAADTPPHEDHDVKRYQPKRQRDHATEEEVEKWNETKANAKRLAKKGISGLKHFASLRNISISRFSGRSDFNYFTECLSFFHGFLGPYTRIQVSSFLFKEVEGYHAEFQTGTTAQEQYRISFGDIEQFFE